jgi:DNA replication protein DnaC
LRIVGKTQVMVAIGHELVRQPRGALHPRLRLVEKLLEAKRDLRLSRELQRLNRFERLALDDIGYVQQDRSIHPARRALRAQERDDHQ